MKQFVFLLIASLALYFVGAYASAALKDKVFTFTAQHLLYVLLIVGSVFGLLLFMFFNHAINIL